jgi:DNA processing protein
MSDQNLLYQLGITLVKGIGNITARQIIETLGDVSLLFKEKAVVLERIPGISRKVIAEIRRPEVLQRAENEIAFLRKNNITPLYINDEDYPQRLKECVDAPVLLFYRGNASLNVGKIISFVGTRNATSYGKEITEKLIHDIALIYPDILIVSGLAYGIDIYSHKAALHEGMLTVGVLAHGLDRIYPPAHRNTAAEMLEHGGLLTDFLSGTNPDRQNFVKRNRIVAGMADCTLVVESAAKGGALITSRIADSYHRDVFAVPGKATDTYSQGCNALIKSRRAALVTEAGDIFREMGWEKETKSPTPVQRNWLVDLNPEEQAVATLLSRNESLQLNVLCIQLNRPISQLAPLLFEMEMKGVVQCLPGGVYRLI